MIDLAELEKTGVTVRKFCGLDIEDGVGCPEEAVGEIIAAMEDGIEIPVPICNIHLKMIQSEFDVEGLSI